MPIIYYKDSIKKSVKDDLFTTIAKQYVGQFKVDKQGKEINSAQIRKFYQEALTIESKINEADDKDQEYHMQKPYINMIKAKAEYARSRKHVGDKFVSFIEENLIDTVDDYRDYGVFCDLFESIIAYYGK
ncbi:MAG TPA: type III-A CRISPR-associated protein Csm2 [Candidatus Margulisbacteria bacterium]|nr:MAG: type III-A CRISPR-associated protein Csm2 [Candidatus Margulisbacteria bacterium GWF2_38_17]HCT84705.1 type III-A CRISPR-associated protein Csm2 [Candidatus Margulisiibacteriota bacterium]